MIKCYYDYNPNWIWKELVLELIRLTHITKPFCFIMNNCMGGKIAKWGSLATLTCEVIYSLLLLHFSDNIKVLSKSSFHSLMILPYLYTLCFPHLELQSFQHSFLPGLLPFNFIPGGLNNTML